MISAAKISNVEKWVLNVIFTSVFLELFIGGSGRLIEINSFLTLRMCLFMVYMVLIVLFIISGNPLSKPVLIIIGYFTLTTTLSLLIGFSAGTALPSMLEDVKPLLNIFLLIYLWYSINSVKDIRYILKLIKISAVILIILHLVLYYLYLQYSDIAILYSALSPAPEDVDKTMFFFKGTTGFVNYTGDVYLCVGFIVWDQYHKNSILKYIVLFFLVISIILTGTRGLILALAGVYLVKWAILKLNYKSLVYLIVGVITVGVIFSQLKDSIGDKDESDQTRYDAINQVIERITPVSVIFGHGFGFGVPVRPEHMEISYLEVFNKQGIIGLIYYAIIFFTSYLFYKKCKIKNSMGLYMFVLFVYFVSFTNPYINHPLGITIISVALISMIKLSYFEKNETASLM